MQRFACFFIGILLIGCKSAGTGDTTAAGGAGKSADVLSLTGPGGKVSLGDTLDKAKAAFPKPAGAMEFPNAMNFAIVTHDGWSWATSKEPVEGFEAATKDGKIIALARTGGDLAGEPDKTIAQIGQPARKVDGKTVSCTVWESGDDARFFIQMKKGNALMAIGGLTVIGKKTDLALMNYRADDPQTFVKQMDATSEQMNSPEMKKLFEHAKEQAKKGK